MALPESTHQSTTSERIGNSWVQSYSTLKYRYEQFPSHQIVVENSFKVGEIELVILRTYGGATVFRKSDWEKLKKDFNLAW